MEKRISLDVLNLSTRPYNALRRAGVDSVQDLAALSDAQLKEIPYLGEQSMQEVKEALLAFAEHGAGNDAELAEEKAEAPAPDWPFEDAVNAADKWLAAEGSLDFLRKLSEEKGVSLSYLAGKLSRIAYYLGDFDSPSFPERLKSQVASYAHELAQDLNAFRAVSDEDV